MRKLLLTLLLIPFCTIVIAQDYKISPWFEGKGSAIVLSFDDGTDDHPNNAIPILNKHGIHGTFYVNYPQNQKYDWHKKALAEGHEISNHTQNHPHLLTLDATELKNEISDFKKTLMEETGSAVSTFAYPYGEGSEVGVFAHGVQDSVANMHIAGRGVYSHGVESFPYNFAPTNRDYYQLPTLTTVAENFYPMIDLCAKDGGLLPLMYHGIGAPGVFENISLEKFEEQINYIKAKGDSVWITTLEHAIQYHRERKGAKLEEISKPFKIENNWRLSLTDTVRDDWYYFPLSIKLAIPESITAVTAVSQNGHELGFYVDEDTVYFNAVPDRGYIDLDILDCQQADAELTITGKDTFCLPEQMTFELPDNPEYEYSWYRDNELLEETSNKLIAQETGIYKAKIILNECPIVTPKTKIVVTGTCGVPLTDFTVDKDVQFKETSVFFTSTSANLEGEEKYYWNFGTGASLEPGYYGKGPIEVSYDESGSKDISLTVEGSVESIENSKARLLTIEDFTPCHAFKQDFNQGHNASFFQGWHNFKFKTHNDALRIKTFQEGAHQWHTLDYAFNDGEKETLIDFSEPLTDPILKLRIKASDTCRLAISLVDNKGVATVGSIINNVGGLDITAEYQEFEIDFSQLFFQEWEGKEVDSTNIKFIRIAINQGYKDWPFTNKYGFAIDKAFVGTVDIDWISLGQGCEIEKLEANIVTPNIVCQDSSFTVYNHSHIDLTNATLNWTFGSGENIQEITTNGNEAIEPNFETSGNQNISLTITTTNEQIITVSESIKVNVCEEPVTPEEPIDPVEPTDPLGFSTGTKTSDIKLIFKNPFNNSIKGSIYSASTTNGVMSIYDINGSLIINKEINLVQGINDIELNTSSLPQGMYYIKLTTNKTAQSSLLLKMGD